jgi:hypothetical protein
MLGQVQASPHIIMVQRMQLVMLMMDPTERSIPPIRMAKVCPTLTMARGPACRARLKRLVGFKKVGDRIAATIKSPTNPMKTAANCPLGRNHHIQLGGEV